LFVGFDREVERADAAALGVVERDLGDDHLDANLGEEDVDLVDEFADEADIVESAGDDDGVAAVVGEDGDEIAEFVGAVGEHGVDRGGFGRGRGLTGSDGAWAAAGFLRGAGLAGDELAEEGGDLFCGGVLEVDDFVAGVGVGAGVEFGDEFVEERDLAFVGEKDDLVGAVVGAVGERGAKLILKRADEHRADLVYDIAGFGAVAERVELRREAGHHGLVEFVDEELDSLEVGDRVGDEGGVGFVEGDDAVGDAGRKERRHLRDELVDAEELELKELRRDAAARREFEGGAGDHLGRLGFDLGEGDDLQEFIAERSDADLVEGEDGFEGEDRFGLRDLFIDDEPVGGGRKLLGAQDRAAGVDLEEAEDGIDVGVGQLDGADEFVGGGGGGGGLDGRRLRAERDGQKEDGGEAEKTQAHARRTEGDAVEGRSK